MYEVMPTLLRIFGRFFSFEDRWKMEGGIEDVEVDGIDPSDYPDFCDAFIASAHWKKSGVALTESELEKIDSSAVYEFVERSLY